MASELRVNQITSQTGLGTVTFDNAGGVSFVNTTPTFNNVSLVSINGGAIGGNKSRIINGDMRIDQRNSGSSVSVSSDGFASRQFPVDRWGLQKAGACVLSGQRTTNSVSDFGNSLRVTVTTPDTSISSSDYAILYQRIEGFNFADFLYGTSSAKTSTLSFWVRSSIAGVYYVSFGNYADNRMYAARYTINAANIWEYKTITIPGDTTGTWYTDNQGGININWVLGNGNFGTANVWGSSVLNSASDQTQLISTTNATFDLTGVQFEMGSTASVFERRSYGQELALCQRYFENVTGSIRAGQYGSFIGATAPFKATKRASPTCTFVSLGNNAGVSFQSFVTGFVSGMDLEGCFPQWNAASGGHDYGYKITASAEL